MKVFLHRKTVSIYFVVIVVFVDVFIKTPCTGVKINSMDLKLRLLGLGTKNKKHLRR